MIVPDDQPPDYTGASLAPQFRRPNPGEIATGWLTEKLPAREGRQPGKGPIRFPDGRIGEVYNDFTIRFLASSLCKVHEQDGAWHFLIGVV